MGTGFYLRINTLLMTPLFGISETLTVALLKCRGVSPARSRASGFSLLQTLTGSLELTAATG